MFDTDVPRRRTAAVACATLVGVWLCCAGAAEARGHHSRVVPKGTPYAAEVWASIIGTADVRYVDDNTTYNVCETQPAETKTDQAFSFDWFARYRHVTVPVADARELGRAVRRLHVTAQPTSDGTGGLTAGDYDISGFGPPTTEGNQPAGGSDCSKKPYSQTGRFHSIDVPSFVRQDTRNFYGDVKHLFVFLMPPIFAKPPTYVDNMGTTIRVYDALSAATNLVPASPNVLVTQPTWNGVPADFDIGELRQLVRRSKVTLTPSVYKGSHDCSSGSDSVSKDVCTLTWTYRWTVTLHRKSLYRTRRAYAR